MFVFSFAENDIGKKVICERLDVFTFSYVMSAPDIQTDSSVFMTPMKQGIAINPSIISLLSTLLFASLHLLGVSVFLRFFPKNLSNRERHFCLLITAHASAHGVTSKPIKPPLQLEGFQSDVEEIFGASPVLPVLKVVKAVDAESIEFIPINV